MEVLVAVMTDLETMTIVALGILVLAVLHQDSLVKVTGSVQDVRTRTLHGVMNAIAVKSLKLTTVVPVIVERHSEEDSKIEIAGQAVVLVAALVLIEVGQCVVQVEVTDHQEETVKDHINYSFNELHNLLVSPFSILKLTNDWKIPHGPSQKNKNDRF